MRWSGSGYVSSFPLKPPMALRKIGLSETLQEDVKEIQKMHPTIQTILKKSYPAQYGNFFYRFFYLPN